jgi:hypothetical protein
MNDTAIARSTRPGARREFDGPGRLASGDDDGGGKNHPVVNQEVKLDGQEYLVMRDD